MSRIQKILIGVFFGGVLLCGIGTGVAFVEFSSFEYGGEKKIGTETLVTEKLDFAFESEHGRLIVGKGRWGNIRNGQITTNASVPEGTIRYVVTYNEEMVKPYLAYEECEEEESFPSKEKYATEGSEGEDSGQAGEEGQEDMLQGYLRLNMDYMGSETKALLEMKDAILSELRQRRISYYDVMYVESVEIQVNPQTLPYIVDEDTYNGRRFVMN